MSFRLRVLALLMLVAVVATGATAWLTLRQVSRQARDSVAADRDQVARVVEGLRDYGFTHGTWDGVSASVRELAAATGQRIRAGTQSGVVLADSDALAGRQPREVGGGPAVVVDPRPQLRLPAFRVALSGVKVTLTAISDYRGAVAYAACLTHVGRPVTARADAMGVPVVDADHDPRCQGARSAAGAADGGAGDRRAVGRCAAEPQPTACLQEVFEQRTAAVAPQPLEVRLGARDEALPSPAAAPTVGVAAGVACAVIAGALLLSRAVLRPVRALTAAAQGLGSGDLGRRVPASGRDEIARLGAAFNRMAASLQASEERQRRLVGDIAHELRTPLANLRGYLEALQDGLVEPGPELFDSLHDEAMLQQRIVDDLQDLALAEAGALTYHMTGIDLRDLLGSSRNAHRAQAAASGVALAVDAPRPVHVRADADRLRQVVGNLLQNALRATAPGGTVTLAAAERQGRAVLQVRDTGKGIPAEDLPRLFDRFWRADPARGRATGGSGLGLSIARRIVTDHGGTIEVDSRVGAGTTFTITLEAARPEAD